MPKVSKAVIVPTITCLAAVVCTSAVWIGAYYIGVKGNDNDRIITVTSEPEPSVDDPSIADVACLSPCEFHLVESVPRNLTYSVTPQFMSTTNAWLKLISMATTSINIASFYWSFLPEDTDGYYDESTEEGKSVFESLIAAARERNISLRITQNAQANNETAFLSKQGLAKVRSLNFTDFLGAGILHTKAWSVDGKHLYVGSANFDWRSLTQVKELGVAIYNCPCLAQDIEKMMEVYWEMGAPNMQIPRKWPSSLGTAFNRANPMSVRLNDQPSAVYFSSAPLEFCSNGRDNDIDAILHVINTAQDFIHISVMDYIPAIIYEGSKNKYWPVIDDALRAAAYRFVNVKLLISRWGHTKTSMYAFLNSLANVDTALPCIFKYNTTLNKTVCAQKGSVKIRLFEVPTYGNQSQIPFARVNHNKYMVTEKAAYIGTSNWSGDYFESTAGFGITIKGEDVMQASGIVKDVNEKIFMRDWDSLYAKSIYDFDIYGKPKN